MTKGESVLPESVLNESSAERQQSTNFNSKEAVIRRLRRGASARAKFVESHISKGLAFQIRSLREKVGWSQQELASKIGSKQNAVYRAENPNYGKQTLSTLRKIAAAFDVGLVVRFASFSELVDWTTTTPHLVTGLTSAALSPENFNAEEQAKVSNEAMQTGAVKAQLPRMTAATAVGNPLASFSPVATGALEADVLGALNQPTNELPGPAIKGEAINAAKRLLEQIAKGRRPAQAADEEARRQTVKSFTPPIDTAENRQAA